MLLDVSMPGGGLQVLRSLLSLRPEMKIALFSIRDELAIVRGGLKAGAVGFISKGTGPLDLVASLRRIAKGERYVSPELAARLIVDDQEIISEPIDRVEGRLATLNAREKKLLSYLGMGLGNSEISHRMGLTENTARQYTSLLLQKLGLKNRTEAALLARKEA